MTAPLTPQAQINVRKPEYRVWLNMKSRCYYPKNDSYARYGGRGIKVDLSWLHNFQQFISDVGPRPSKNYSLDRIDVDADYSPSNCRWANPKEQGRNRANNKLVTINGITKIECVWIEEYGITNSAYYKRLRRGWTHERALNTPLLSFPHNVKAA